MHPHFLSRTMKEYLVTTLLWLGLLTGVVLGSDFEQARKLQNEGRYSEAEQLYRAVLKAQPKSVPAWTNLGVVLSRQGKHAEAVSAYKKVLQLDPSLHPVKLNLAIAYYQSGDWTQAVKWLQICLRVDPNDRRAQHLLAICYVQTGQYDKAAQAFAKLLPSEDISINV